MYLKIIFFLKSGRARFSGTGGDDHQFFFYVALAIFISAEKLNIAAYRIYFKPCCSFVHDVIVKHCNYCQHTNNSVL
jgi:hypothetical protein